MLRKTIMLAALLLGTSAALARPAVSKAAAGADGHYLFVWAGDQDKQGNDFLAVINADPGSPEYGRLVTSVGTDQKSVRIHHTEYEMPASGMLFANDHDANRTFIFDLRDPRHPKVATSFTDMAGYSHPHSFLRLPNGNVLASFQHRAQAMAHGAIDHSSSGHSAMAAGVQEKTGGLVEIDDAGRVIRSASSADPAFRGEVLMPYSLAVLPGIDRVVSTNSSMHDDNLMLGTTFQLWRLSDLKLLKTEYLGVGKTRTGHIDPEEPRVGQDGAVYVQTLSCGIERITELAGENPVATLVHTFPGNFCGVPTIVGHYLIQSVEATHGYIVIDIADGAHPVEVSRLSLGDDYVPHWTSWDAKAQRLIVTPNVGSRAYLLKLDMATGTLSIDDKFRDIDGKVGFSFASRSWPHGWTGTGKPHGAVGSR